MDRVRVLAPTLLAAWALLGAQGARVGSYSVPALSFRWVFLAVALSFLLTPRQQGGRLGLRSGLLGVALLLSFTALTLWRGAALDPAFGARALINGEREVVASSLQLELRRDLRRLTGERRNVTLETQAILEVPRDGEYRFELECDDVCDITIGEHRIRDGETLTLGRGEVPFALRYRQLGGPAALRFEWRTPSVIELLPIEYYLRSGEPRHRQRLAANASLFLSIVWWLGFSVYVARLAPFRGQLFQSRWVPATAATLILLYGSLLRLDALLVHAGLDGHEHLSQIVPRYALFNPASAPDDPYRADVRSYLDRAEDFTWTSFYAPSFREPFYIALTMPFLALTGSEIGILVQSFVFSCATLALFFFVARKLHGRWWAVGLLIPVALHEWLVLEAPSGYRMSAYAFLLLASVAMMFLGPSGKKGATIAGVLFGLLCLVRLSALSIVVPLLAIKLWPLERRERIAYGAIFTVVLVVLVGPFLASNAVANGDPFYSISFHTEFWLRAEGLTSNGEGPVAWTRYFTDFGRMGTLAQGTLLGMTVLPVKTFWNGLRHFPILNLVALSMGIAGLALSFRTSRVFLAGAYLGHLIPFAYIQNFPSGEMPRFVMPAYLFLVLAVPLAAGSILTRGKAAANVDAS